MELATLIANIVAALVAGGVSGAVTARIVLRRQTAGRDILSGRSSSGTHSPTGDYNQVGGSRGNDNSVNSSGGSLAAGRDLNMEDRRRLDKRQD